MAQLPDWITLRILLAAVELGSVTRAAERCGIATSAATKRLQSLELDMKVTLLTRSVRGVEATSAGELLCQRARALLNHAESISHDFHVLAAGGTGQLRIQATPSILAGHGLAESVTAFAKERPGVQIVLQEDHTLAITRAVLEGRVDIGFVTSAGAVSPGMQSTPWRTDRVQVVVAADDPLAQRSELAFWEVAERPMIGVYAQGSLTLQLEEAAQRVGHRLNYVHTINSIDAARRFVAAGAGIAIMPESTVADYEDALGIRGVPLSDTWAVRALQVLTATPENASGLTLAFLRQLGVAMRPSQAA